MSNELKVAATSFAALLQAATPAFADNGGNGAVGVSTNQTIPDPTNGAVHGPSNEAVLVSCTRAGDPPFVYTEEGKRWCNIPDANTTEAPNTHTVNVNTTTVGATVDTTTVGATVDTTTVGATVDTTTVGATVGATVDTTTVGATVRTKVDTTVVRRNPAFAAPEKATVPQKAEPSHPGLPTATEVFIRAGREKETDALRAPVNFANEKTGRGVTIAPIAPIAPAFGNK